jgi:hypothetical protein
MRIKKIAEHLFLCALLFLALCGGVKAQSIVTGAISGTVTDASGAILTDTKVTLVNEATQESQSTATGATGSYRFPLLKPGKYNVIVEKPGFHRLVEKKRRAAGPDNHCECAIGNR